MAGSGTNGRDYRYDYFPDKNIKPAPTKTKEIPPISSVLGWCAKRELKKRREIRKRNKQGNTKRGPFR